MTAVHGMRLVEQVDERGVVARHRPARLPVERDLQLVAWGQPAVIEGVAGWGHVIAEGDVQPVGIRPARMMATAPKRSASSTASASTAFLRRRIQRYGQALSCSRVNATHGPASVIGCKGCGTVTV